MPAGNHERMQELYVDAIAAISLLKLASSKLEYITIHSITALEPNVHTVSEVLLPC